MMKDVNQNVLILFPIFAVWYLIGFFLQVFWHVPAILAFSKPLFLVFYACCLIEMLAKQTTKQVGYWLALICVGSVTYLVEVISVATGFPFGSYRYTPVLGPNLIGVPITITLAWIGVLFNSMYLANQKTKLLRALETGVWIVVLDLILDPVAEVESFWEWNGNGSYFGIPITNFVTWFILGAILSLMFPLYPKQHNIHRKITWVYQGMLLLFGLLAFRNGIATIGVLSIAFILLVEGRYQYDYRSQK
ncbi:carotenoid biosynthesis protein [Paraliobacillus ryukyuensis]|uniref:carotenoid biosynthesis protein n=1 Tax=Paraliobacillus ryukyuensis TaxID=200904 RepID=UPI0009A5D453|nr:carotenoid biosynthesis protein [Paraliobacillus ryukyuensis]